MTEKRQVTGVKTPEFMLPNAASTAEGILNQAFGFCAAKLRLDVQAAVAQLKQRDPSACSYCQYSIAKQVGETLGHLDTNIQAVYLMDYDATPEDVCFGEAGRVRLIHLIAHVTCKTSALKSLVAALDRALVDSYARLMGLDQLEHLLDIQLVEDKEVQERTGYGAMLASVHQSPLRVWNR